MKMCLPHLVDVGLVDLIGHEHDILVMAELDDVLQVLNREALPGGIACTRAEHWHSRNCVSLGKTGLDCKLAISLSPACSAASRQPRAQLHCSIHRMSLIARRACLG